MDPGAVTAPLLDVPLHYQANVTKRKSVRSSRSSMKMSFLFDTLNSFDSILASNILVRLINISIPFIICTTLSIRVVGKVEPMPLGFRLDAGFSLNRSLIDHRA